MTSSKQFPPIYYLGIDLGKTGGLALLNSAGKIVTYEAMPETPEEIIKSLINLCSWALEGEVQASVHIVMESVSPRPEEGVVSVATFAKHCGGVYYTCIMIHLTMDGVQFPSRIAPMLWKKTFGLIDSKASKYEKKKASVDFVNARYKQGFKYKDNGITDAILIAEHARLEVENAQQECS
ncbi:MAG: hypothetical protein WC248_08750 [Candidatus Methanomethylophilaceae archaeon]|jgi:hypothetical protein